MDALFRQALTLTQLRAARDRVYANRGCAGVDGQTVADFAAGGDLALRDLTAQILGGHYQPQPLLRIWIDRPGKTPRGLAVPTVQDRVAQTSVAQVLTPLAEAQAEDCSYGYRLGRGVQQAAARVEACLRDGFCWIVEADIEGFFDHVDHTVLLRHLQALVPNEPRLRALVQQWLVTPIAEAGQVSAPRTVGIAQGSPLSPLLANLYLDTLDEWLLDANHKLVRFADDFVILARTRERADEALALSREVVERLALRLNPLKTRIVHSDQGFEFLGWNFVRTLALPKRRESDEAAHAPQLPSQAEPLNPDGAEAWAPPPQVLDADEPEPLAEGEAAAAQPAEPGLPALAPLQRTLYLVDPEVELGAENARLVVRKQGRALLAVSALHVDQVMVLGRAQVSTQALQLVSRSGGAVGYLSRLGRYYGRYEGADGSALGLLEAQFERARDPAFALDIARNLIAAKLRNSATVLTRAMRHAQLPSALARECQRAPSLLREWADGAQRSPDLAALRGTEGAAAAQHFRVLQALIPGAWGFTRRLAHPAPDAVNALLSFGYSVLYQAVAGLLRARGLHAHLGLFHAQGGAHMALASDLMEPYRAYAVDAVVLRLIRRQTLATDCGEARGDAFQLHATSSRQFIHALETRFNTPMLHPQSREPVDLRRLIDADLRRFIQALRTNAPRDFWPTVWH